MPRMVNLGCGQRTHPSWINVDSSPINAIKTWWLGRQAVRLGLLTALPDNYENHDLRKGVPFESNSVDVIYMSHVLEHLDRQYVIGFLQEIWRVLRPNGILRISVPDLERIVNNYSKALSDCRANPQDEKAIQRYRHAMLDLFDQMVRTTSGGELAIYYSEQIDRPTPPVKNDWMTRVKRWAASWIAPNDPGKRGELHRWMYDEYSLGQLLHNAGFVKIQRTDYNESSIPGWVEFCLDNKPDGTEYKPGSLYFEATKPS